MKKVLCLILAVTMLISLSGCFGDNEPEDVRGDIVTQTPDQSADITQGEAEFSLGKTANNTYNNDFLGISCTLPSEWEFYTDKQILEINNMVDDVLDEKTTEALKEADVVYDMYANCASDGSSININLEKFNVIQILALDLKQTLESQIDVIKQSYQNMGYTDINVNYQKTTVDSKEFDSLKLTAKIEGIDFYGTIFSFKKSNYMANVTVCSLLTDTTDTILIYFSIK